MVSLEQVQASNSRIASSLPPGLVAVFVGATGGIGATTLRQFAKHARKPRIYFTGRSQESADQITAECKSLNADGEYNYIKADTSLIRTVDEVCREIKGKEKTVNLMVLCTGSLVFDRETPEGLNYALALAFYCRNRFILNLLPLLQQAQGLRRVVTVFAGGKEGHLDLDDVPGRKVSMLSLRGHGSSLVTLSLAALAQRAPEVSFIHDFPGAVKTDLAKDTTGVLMFIVKAVFAVIGPWIYIPNQECGERHLFLATSERYPPASVPDGAVMAGVPLENGLTEATGIDGNKGGGVYTVGSDGESAGSDVVDVLAGLKQRGAVEKIWKHLEDEFGRITGQETV